MYHNPLSDVGYWVQKPFIIHTFNPHEPTNMKINVKTMIGTNISFQVNENDTIWTVKEKIRQDGKFYCIKVKVYNIIQKIFASTEFSKYTN